MTLSVPCCRVWTGAGAGAQREGCALQEGVRQARAGQLQVPPVPSEANGLPAFNRPVKCVVTGRCSACKLGQHGNDAMLCSLS